MTILSEIFESKNIEVNFRKQNLPIEELIDRCSRVEPPLAFVPMLIGRSKDNESPALIAEVKRASPSKGDLGMHIDPLDLARIYQQNGASAISVLTDEPYFKGSLEFLKVIKNFEIGLPVLRKDFIFDPYQIYESRAAGADAVLLIVAGLDPKLLIDLHTLIMELGMTPLVEIHEESELGLALECDPVLIGVNNRDLRNFSVDLTTTLQLRKNIPQEICLVSESGIHSAKDVRKLADAGVDAILVGEALVTADDIAVKVRELVSGRALFTQ